MYLRLAVPYRCHLDLELPLQGQSQLIEINGAFGCFQRKLHVRTAVEHRDLAAIALRTGLGRRAADE